MLDPQIFGSKILAIRAITVFTRPFVLIAFVAFAAIKY
jgi:hypothetical protein